MAPLWHHADLDNARIYHAQPFLDAHRETLTLLFLPPNSPRLNRIEDPRDG